MTYHLDPHEYWERQWESSNPEPHPIPMGLDDKGQHVWLWEHTAERIEWHRMRWEAYKEEFKREIAQAAIDKKTGLLHEL